MGELRFDGRVAIITGAGAGLGRAYALELSRRGAAVVVNDLGGSISGEGSSRAADEVVDEIRSNGGRAIADFGSVTDQNAMNEMAARVVSEFGRIDILVANAGIIRDRTFAKMGAADFEDVVDVHLMGTVRTVRAVWPTMVGQGGGRIIVTTSGSGLFGGFGQSNYAAAKMGIIGFMNVLKVEGAKSSIKVNAIGPMALTRMSADAMPEALAKRSHPNHVAAALVYLASDEGPNGVILNAGGGLYSSSRIVDSVGITVADENISAETVRDRWEEIANTSGERGWKNMSDYSRYLVEKIMSVS